MVTPLEAIDEMFHELDVLQQQHQQKSAFARLFARLPKDGFLMSDAKSQYASAMGDLKRRADDLEFRHGL